MSMFKRLWPILAVALVVALLVASATYHPRPSTPSVADTSIKLVKFGTQSPYCKTHFKSARAKLPHASTGVTAYATQQTCAKRSKFGSKYVTWTGTPHATFVADGLGGGLQKFDVTWGPKLTRVQHHRMTPWQWPLPYNPAYIAWWASEKVLGHKPVRRPVTITHSYSVRVCTISVAGSQECRDADMKTVNKMGFGLKVCIVAPDPKCGAWRRFT